MVNQYWASAPIEEIAEKVQSKFDEYRQHLKSSGYGSRIRKVYEAFYGFNSDGTLEVSRNKEQIARINVNHLKSLIKRLHILVTENKLAFQPRAKSSDTKSQIESDLAKGIVEYYGDEKNMHSVLSRSVLGCLIQLEQHVHCPWDMAEGYELTANENQIIKTGDQIFEILSPFDVAYNTASEASPWKIVRVKVNKYDTAILHPEFSDEILASSLEKEVEGLHSGGSNSLGSDVSDDSQDFTYKLILYHARTPSVQRGRKVEIVAGQVLSDGDLVYDKIPCFKITAGDILGTNFGDSPAIELLPLQEALNAIFSATLTNNLNNSLQLIWSADPNLVTRMLSDGQTLVTSASPPQALNLTGSAAENFKMIDLLQNNQQLLSAVNDTARGNPNSTVKTSGGQALMIAQAIQYVSDLQQNYARLASDVASCLVSNIQIFATETMTAYITGVTKKGQIKKFKSEDIMQVERITCDLGSPLTQSLAGRHELVAAWTQMGMLKDPKAVVSFLSSGNLDQGTENEFSDAILIRDENEQIRKGIKPIVVITDNHPGHIISHKSVYSDPAVRNDPAIMAVALEHLQEHIDAERSVPPDLKAILSGQPLPPIDMPAPQDQQPQINGVNLPNVPNGTPPQVAQNYDQVMNSAPTTAQEGF